MVSHQGVCGVSCGLASSWNAYKLMVVRVAAQASGAVEGTKEVLEEGPAKRLRRRMLADEERADLPHEEKPWVPANRPPTAPAGDVRPRPAACGVISEA